MITARDKLACAERELRMRQHVYVRRVNDGKMTAKDADWEIACMEAIVTDYRHDIEMADRQGKLL